MSYLVTAPLVVPKDQAGRNHHHYRGSVIPWLSPEQREHFLSMGLVEEIDSKEAAERTGVEEPKQPSKTAPVSAWVDYGVHKGHDRDELEALSKQDLVELLG